MVDNFSFGFRFLVSFKQREAPGGPPGSKRAREDIVTSCSLGCCDSMRLAATETVQVQPSLLKEGITSGKKARGVSPPSGQIESVK
jgi:hypothetical protein